MSIAVTVKVAGRAVAKALPIDLLPQEARGRPQAVSRGIFGE
jgi:hypothetical protein